MSTNVAMVLRAAVKELGPRGPGRRYPDEVRARIAAYVRQRRAEGVQVQDIAAELGIRRGVLRRWAQETPPLDSPAFKPVAILADEPKGLVLHGPRGFRVEGLDIDGLAALLVRLG